MIAYFSKATESPHLSPPVTMWLVEAEWRGGHNNRLFRVMKLYINEKEAIREWQQLTPENHCKKYHFPPGTASAFKRYSIRVLTEVFR